MPYIRNWKLEIGIIWRRHADQSYHRMLFITADLAPSRERLQEEIQSTNNKRTAH